MKANCKKLAAIMTVTALMATTFVGCGAKEIEESKQASESTPTVVESASDTQVSADVVEEFSYPMDGRTITNTCYLAGSVKSTATSKNETSFNELL